ncbi:hypothetical protein BLNAU_18198 [Blattamonas nauphoetae]|uniref:Uncharacterized protein n=1 Tax=Blattamonas nauphoetae TaxID=2049346 RepID=A0ABQ9X6F6_9EUKA|nr:hypothetical protein BLNAU_18198 [Blattamonas nauphoetae]
MSGATNQFLGFEIVLSSKYENERSNNGRDALGTFGVFEGLDSEPAAIGDFEVGGEIVNINRASKVSPLEYVTVVDEFGVGCRSDGGEFEVLLATFWESGWEDAVLTGEGEVSLGNVPLVIFDEG